MRDKVDGEVACGKAGVGDVRGREQAAGVVSTFVIRFGVVSSQVSVR